MAEVLVINTGPLIALERMACLNQVGRLPFEFVCPEQVRQELDEGHAAGYPLIDPPWLRTRSVSEPLSRLLTSELDPAEGAVLQLATEIDAAAVVIDEWKGRRLALSLGLRVTGSLGLLGRAKMHGLVPSVRPLIERAVAAGIRYHPTVIQAVLAEVGEGTS